MPHITAAMQWSRRRSIADIVVKSLLGRRSITSQATGIKDSFSSWDNCMKATYCKWPIIAAIIVVGLILLSIITCIVRCACCGMSCCCTCFRCLSCCDCCGDSCEGKKNKPVKNRDEPFAPSPFASAPPLGQGYQAPAPMMGGALPAPVAPGPPQYAQFEVGKNGLYVEPKPPASVISEDALPPMPSWDGAVKKHVATEEEKAIELGDLDPTTGQKVPLMAGAAGTGISAPPSPGNEFPHSPYGARHGQGAGSNGYMNLPGDQYGQQNRGGFNASPSPSMVGFQGPPNPGMGGPGRFGSPAPGMGGQGRYGSPAPQGPGRGGGDAYGAGPGRGGPDRYGSPGPQAMNRPGRGYGPTSPQDLYAPNDGFGGAVPGGYGRPPPNTQYSNDQYSNNGQQFPPPNRQYTNESPRPQPGRQYTDRSERPAGQGYPADNFLPQGAPRGPSRGPGGPQRLASPPLNNNSGFDFGGGYQSPSSQQYNAPAELESMPSPSLQQRSYGGRGQGDQGQGERRRRPSAPQHEESGYGGFGNGRATGSSSYASRGPPAQEPTYPGYKPYQPTNQGGSSRGQREPQGWDPVHQ